MYPAGKLLKKSIDVAWRAEVKGQSAPKCNSQFRNEVEKDNTQ